MKRNALIFGLVATASLAVTAPSMAATIATSTFDANDEGWTIDGNNNGLVWESGFGNPPGSIHGFDASGGGLGSTWKFSAPASYLGNQSAAFGGTFTYDLQINTAVTNNTAPAIEFVGNNGDILEAFVPQGSNPEPNDSGFTTYSWTLSAASHTWAGSQATITDDFIFDILSDLEAIYIKGEYSTQVAADQAWLDNVLFATGTTPPPVGTPEPGTLLGILGVGALSLVRRRNK